MVAALFLIETAKSELEEAGLPQAEAVSKASDSRRNDRKNSGSARQCGMSNRRPNPKRRFQAVQGLSTARITLINASGPNGFGKNA
jgi:hypothetical protein